MKEPFVLILLFAFMFLSTSSFAGWDEGVAAFTKRDYKTAAIEFQSVVEQNPDGYRGHYMLGLSLEQLKRKEESLHHLRKAYDLNPNDLSVKVALGRAYYRNRRYAEAIEPLDQAVNDDPGNVESHKYLGLSYSKTKRKEEALTHLRKAYDLNPNDLTVKSNLDRLSSNSKSRKSRR